MLGAGPKQWWRRPVPAKRQRCYRKKSDALKLFIDTNRSTIDNYGGETYEVSPSEFDAVNHKYGTQARRIVDALWAALPVKKAPYCFDDIDLDALNDTSPAREGGAFRLPDFMHEAGPGYDPDAIRPPPKHWRKTVADWRERNRLSKRAIADECGVNRYGTYRCICRNDSTGRIMSCAVKNKLRSEVPF